MPTEEWLRRMPKIELHRHFEGALSARTLQRLTREATGAELPLEQVRNSICVSDTCRDLAEFLGKFGPIVEHLQTEREIEEAALAQVREAAAEGIVYLELRFAPQLLREKGLSISAVAESFLRGIHRGETECGTAVRGLLIAMRSHTLAQNLEVLAAAEAYRDDGIVGLDFAGDEASYPPLTQARLFEEAARRGVPFVLHAGESGAPENIKEALLLGARRIGHGVHCVYDPYLVAYLAERGVCLELCPTSNLVTSAVAGWEEHPLRRLLDKGVCVTVNTDDPAVLGIDLVEEYRRAATHFGFSAREFEQVNRNALRAALCDEETRRGVEARLDSFFC